MQIHDSEGDRLTVGLIWFTLTKGVPSPLEIYGDLIQS